MNIDIIIRYVEAISDDLFLIFLTGRKISIPAVPEPSTWAMMLIGFFGLGFAFRQSRRNVSFA
jgi:hypothetical protein